MHHNKPSTLSDKIKDFKDLAKLKGERNGNTVNQDRKAINPDAFNLDEDDPELDLKTWLPAESIMTKQYMRLGVSEVSVRFGVSSAWRRKLNAARNAIIEAKEMYIRFGNKVLKNLGWSHGDKIGIFVHPTDKTVYGLMPQKNGWKINQEGEHSGVYYLNFAFKNDLRYLTQGSKIVEHAIHENGYLLLRLPPKEKE